VMAMDQKQRRSVCSTHLPDCNAYVCILRVEARKVESSLGGRDGYEFG